MDNYSNSTGPETVQSGEQEGVVGLPTAESGNAQTAAVRQSQQDQSPTDAESGAGREDVAGLRHSNSDFALVDVGEDGSRPSDRANAEDTALAGDDGGIAPDGAGQDSGRQQTREENAAIRAARIRAQRDAEAAAMAKAAARTDEEIANSGVINPYTGRPFSSMREFREYGDKLRKADIAKRAKQTGRSVADIEEDEANRAFISSLRRAAERKDSGAQTEPVWRPDTGAGPQTGGQTGKGGELDFFRQDLNAFRAAYPNVDVAALDRNPRFRRFVGSRYGREPLASLYGDYLDIVGEAGAAAVAKAENRSTRSTGGGTSGGSHLSPTQKAELDRWNQEHPEMKMTAKEFMQR